MTAPEADYRDVAVSLPPAAVSEYLAASGDWVLETRQAGVREIWNLPAPSASPGQNAARGRPQGRIMLPLATDFVDFGQHFRDALSALATINGWTPGQLEREIVSLHADTFLVRLVQEQGGDSLPLRQAETTIDAIYKMLRAAAMTTAAPRQVFRGGRLPGPVSAFLEDDVRLGHTQRGSFVFTVVTQLDDPAGPRPADEEPTGQQAQQFPRRVMENLALGIRTARDLAEGRTATDLSNPSRWGLSAGLVESLMDLTEPESLSSVDLSFDWAAAASRPTVGGQPVSFNHALLEELQRVHELLLQREEPVRHETLIGTVVSLSREDDTLGDGEAAAVIISADVSGRRRNVHLTLTGRQHDLAIQAYRLKMPIVVTGDLTFARRTWHLEGTVELDEDLLLRRIADARNKDA